MIRTIYSLHEECLMTDRSQPGQVTQLVRIQHPLRDVPGQLAQKPWQKSSSICANCPDFHMRRFSTPGSAVAYQIGTDCASLENNAPLVLLDWSEQDEAALKRDTDRRRSMRWCRSGRTSFL